MTSDTDRTHENVEPVPPTSGREKLSIFGRIGALLSSGPRGTLIVPGSEPATLTTDLRVEWQRLPFALGLGNVTVEFHPDLTIEGEEKGKTREWIVHAGKEFYDTVPKFIRIRAGETVVLGRSNEVQTRLFGFDNSVADRHVRVSNRKGELSFQALELERVTTISANISPISIWVARRSNLLRLPGVLGHAFVEYDDDEALQVIREVNAILETETYRDANSDGAPGGVIRFPDDMAVVIMGDVHARADNILQVLTEGGFLAALERGEVCLVLLGDLVHSQEQDELEDMRSTVFILDLFCMLKCRFPENVFYIHGNHESFSPDVGKGGVPQALLMQKYLKNRRGKEYVNEVEKLFNALAYVVQGNEFAACHGAPVRSRVTRESLVNIHNYPGIQAELVWNRLRQGNRPAGYGKGSVKRFRKTLGLSKQAHLFVGHTPLSSEQTLWLDAGGIKGHHVIYSAHTHRLAAALMSGGKMLPLEFVPEQALAFVNGDQGLQ